jgi:hypothetical protein
MSDPLGHVEAVYGRVVTRRVLSKFREAVYPVRCEKLLGRDERKTILKSLRHELSAACCNLPEAALYNPSCYAV